MLCSLDHTGRRRALTEAGGGAERRGKVLDFGCTIQSSAWTQSHHIGVCEGWTLRPACCKAPQVIETAGKAGWRVLEAVVAESRLHEPCHACSHVVSSLAPDAKEDSQESSWNGFVECGK